MTQQAYDMIVKCIQHGASAVSDELITSLNQLINTNKAYEKALKKASEKANDKEVKENK